MFPVYESITKAELAVLVPGEGPYVIPKYMFFSPESISIAFG